MHVRTFIGKNTQEVLEKVKAEMGPDALILSNREFRKNYETFCEITVGIERVEEEANASPPSVDSLESMIPSGQSEWHKEWDRFRKNIYDLMQPAINWDAINPHQRKALEYLQNEGVENDVVVELYHKLKHEGDSSLLDALTDTVCVQPFGKTPWNKHLHAIVGPYGVGKTVTALRLALWLRKKNPELKIAFINTDSTRGNGRLMLRHFAELSGLTSIDAMDKAACVAAIKETIDYDYVFIDMQALAKEENLAQKFKDFGLAKVKQNIVCHLCLSPLYSSGQLDAYIKQYQSNFPTSVIWTKLDESVQYGALVNIALRHKLPISTLSFGAEMNSSLIPAEKSLVWHIILKGQLPTKDEVANS